MELSVSHQLFVVICMFLCGGITGVIFDLFRGYRRCVKSASGIIVAQDLFLWIFELIVVYYTALKVNNAAIRGYAVIALVCGAAFYFLTLSEHMVKAACAATAFILKVWGSVLFPFKKAAEFVIKPFKGTCFRIKKRFFCVKNNAKKFVAKKTGRIKAMLRIKKRKK